MPESIVVRNKRDGQILITDGTKSYTIDKETGDFSFDVPLETVSLYLDRGAIGTTPSIRNVDDQPITGSFTVHHRDLPQTGYTTLADLCLVLTGQYVAGNWSSTIGTSSDTRTFTIQYTVDGTAFGEADRTLTFAFCVLRASFAEGDPNTLSVSFTSYQLRPTVS
jgi:hypothetical protein